MISMICCHSKEVWKDIPGYEGVYEASTFGNIRTCEGKITSNSRYNNRHWKSRILKGRGNNPVTGKRVSLWKDGKPKDFLVARLVALTFIGEPPKGFTVNHKDGNRFNNAIDNLEWLSLADNIRHGFATGLYPQKSIVVSRNRSTHYFQSYSALSRFLNRNHGYVSNALKRGSAIRDKLGNIYEVVKEPPIGG